MKTRKAFAALLAVGLPCVAACGGISFGAGEYSVIRVASSTGSRSGDCNNDPNHTTTFDSGGTFMLYGTPADPADNLFLDTGDEVLEGSEKEDGSFTFTGKTVDVDDIGPITLTHIQTLTIKFTIDGETVKGTAVGVDDQQCAGTGCMPNDSSKCTTTTGFEGVQIPGDDITPH